MAYLTEIQLQAMGFKKVGRNVRISERASIYNAEKIEIGDHSRIDDFCVISGKVTIGRNVYIGVFCNVAGGAPGVTLGDFSTLAYGCHVFSQSDDYHGYTLTNPTVPAKYKNEVKKSVHIHKHCIVGASSLVFPGVTLAEGTAVGAMTLVNKSTAAWSVYLGIPARRVKDRKRGLLELEKQYLQEGL
ncbi:MAG: acyltransferase [Nitrospinaceae bacterium]